MLKSKNILITGASGMVAYPVALSLAKDNSVTAIGRFSDTEKKNALEQAGVSCIVFDLSEDNFDILPNNFDYVLHFAVNREAGLDFDKEIRGNAESTGLLMSRCRSAKAFFHVSSCAVYHPAGRNLLTEESPLGDNHRNMMATYSVGKNAQEAVVRSCARIFNLPSIICRLNVPFGAGGGWPYYHLMMMEAGMKIPVNSDSPSTYTMMHQDDIAASIPKLLGAASVPATIINWSSDQHVSIEEWCGYLEELTGLKPEFDATSDTLPSIMSDNSKLVELTNASFVPWRQGVKELVSALRPDLLTK